VRKYSFFLNYIALFRYLTHPSPGSIELRPHSAIGDRTPLSLIHLPRQQAEVPNCSEPRKLDRFWLEFSAVIPRLGGAESDEGLSRFYGGGDEIGRRKR
jgi:hypothetical protein